MAGRRRASGTGGVIRRSDGRWEARYSERDDSGHLVRKHLYGRTRREAEDKLIDAVRDRNHGALAGARGRAPTFASYVEAWLAGASVRVRPRTLDKYRQLLTAHALPGLGRLALARLEVAHVNHLVAAKRAAGLSPATVAGLRTVIRAVLASAVREGRLTRNVAALADAPHLPDPQRPILAPAEAQSLLQASEGDPDGPLWALAVTTGARLGELLGLRWTDYDPEQRVLRIERSLQRLHGDWLLAEPKTRRARRAIPLAAPALAALDRQRAAQAAQRLRAGTLWAPPFADLIFTGASGSPRLGPALARRLRRESALLGLPNVGFHGLRRTAASLLADAGVPVQTVADYLGDGVTTALKHYVRTVPESRRRAAETLAAILGGAPRLTG